MHAGRSEFSPCHHRSSMVRLFLRFAQFGTQRHWLKNAITAVMSATVCALSVPAWAGYMLSGYDLEVVQSGQGLPHAGISYQMNQAWNETGGNAYQPVTTTFTLPSCNNIDFARLYLDVWGGTPDNTANVGVSVNGQSLPTIYIGGTSDSNPTYNAAETCVYGSGYGMWQLAVAGVGGLLNTNGSANTVTWTVSDPNGQFDGRTYCASLIAVYTDNSLNQTLDYNLAEADGAMQKNGSTGQPSSRTLTISGVNTANVTSATYYAGYTLGPTIKSNTLSFNGTLLGTNTNNVAQAPATGYGGSLVSSNVATILSGTNTVQYSLTMPGYSSYYLRANIGLLDVTHPLPAVSVWAAAVSGNWSKAGNWTGGVPDAVGAGGGHRCRDQCRTDDHPRRPADGGHSGTGQLSKHEPGLYVAWQR